METLFEILWCIFSGFLAAFVLRLYILRDD